MRMNWAFLTAVLIVALAGVAFGGIVYMRDGGKHEGVVRKEGETVFIETTEGVVEVSAEDVIYIAGMPLDNLELDDQTSGGSTSAPAQQAAPADDSSVKTPIREASSSHAAYMVIPLYGAVGGEAHVDTLAKCFNVASAQRASLVILHIDSDGGLVGMKEEILDLLREKKQEFRIVAYVTEANSAAAVIALICDEIVMAPQGVIGGCVPSSRGADGAPEVIAKRLAAEYADVRAIAKEGGHNSLLAEAMINCDMVLSYNETEDGLELVKGKGDMVIKGAGEILNLSAQEAATYALALGVAGSVDEIKDHIGLDSWAEASRRGYAIQTSWEKELADAMDVTASGNALTTEPASTGEEGTSTAEVAPADMYYTVEESGGRFTVVFHNSPLGKYEWQVPNLHGIYIKPTEDKKHYISVSGWQGKVEHVRWDRKDVPAK